MPDPTVVCLMLTADRPALAAKAVECFRAQTYENKRLIVYDTGNPWLRDSFEFIAGESDFPSFSRDGFVSTGKDTIGAIRNRANELTEGECGIIIHWDDDDFSHPNRIAEQVALLEASGADVVGYSEMLFWREPLYTERNYCQEVTGEAWLYTGSILGTSLCYRRAAWEAHPFPATSYGEDTDWLNHIRLARMKVMPETSLFRASGPSGSGFDDLQPRMIARIHAGNTSRAYAPEAMRAAPRHWRRVPEWDEHCRKVME